jgi:hypothetical protein
MEPSVNEVAFAARKTGEVCTSVLSGTTAKNKIKLNIILNQRFGTLGKKEGIQPS